MNKLILLALLAVSPLAQALTDSEEALARIREQTKNQYIYVDEAYIEKLKEEDALARASKYTGIPVEKFLEKPEAPAAKINIDPYQRAVCATLGIPESQCGTRDAGVEQQEQDYGIRWVNVGIAALLSAAALFAGGMGLKATISYLRSNSGTREKVIENSQRLATLVVVCAVLGSFATSSTYEIADSDVP